MRTPTPGGRCLRYELRRQAQYETADEYASDADDADVERFYAWMLFLMDTGLLIAEALIARKVGLIALKEAADAWHRTAYRRAGGATETPLRQRIQALTAAYDPSF